MSKKNKEVYCNNGSQRSKVYVYEYLVDEISKEEFCSFNYALRLNKFSTERYIKKGEKKEQIRGNNRGEIFSKGNCKYKDILNLIETNNDVIKESLKSQYEWICISATTIDKMVIGLGGFSVFENDITLHHTYGIPYIPGQAIKGRLRNHIIEKYFLDEKMTLSKECFKEMFGTDLNDKEDSSKGKIVFLDSYCTSRFKVEEDIINNHHSDYYQENGLPLDSDSPIMNNFLVVKGIKNTEGAKFSFNIGISKEIFSKNYIGIKSVKDFICENVVEVLEYIGLGAKTSVGYGYFNVDSVD